MQHFKLIHMIRGWFVGSFYPTTFCTTACEVGVKHYKAGDKEEMHYHQVATEITLILSGRVRILNREWQKGDIVVLSPGEAVDFEALTDSVNVVVKIPGSVNDKYLGCLK